MHKKITGFVAIPINLTVETEKENEEEIIKENTLKIWCYADNTLYTMELEETLKRSVLYVEEV